MQLQVVEQQPREVLREQRHAEPLAADAAERAVRRVRREVGRLE